VLLNEESVFVENCVKNGLAEKDARKLFDEMVDFGRYAFNKCHATPYALISYQTAYLKSHYPREYMSALLSSVLSNPDKIGRYIADCQDMRIQVLPPDINRSFAEFRPEGKSIRFSLLALRNVGSQFVEFLTRDRVQNGLYSSMEDFMARVDMRTFNKKEFESLIKAGAFDSFGIYRSRLLASYEKMLGDKSAVRSSMVDGQMDLFSTSSGENISSPTFEYPEIPELPGKDKIRFEREVSGLFLSGHLLDDYSEHIRLLKPNSILELLGQSDADEEEDPQHLNVPVAKDRQWVRLCGIVTQKTTKSTKAGEAMAFLTFEDREASIEIIVFPKTLAEYGYLLREDAALQIDGTVSLKDQGEIKIICQKVLPLFENGKIPRDEILRLSNPSPTPKKADKTVPAASAETEKPKPKILYVRVPDMDCEITKRLIGLFDVFTGDTPVVFYDNSRKEYLKTSPMHVSFSDFLLQESRSIAGEENVILH
ncbi:MAG: hypothetical protein II797_03575, partial [Clostridia bacterium]|nr:hypothetical protein [Clostridia bacterium]